MSKRVRLLIMQYCIYLWLICQHCQWRTLYCAGAEWHDDWWMTDNKRRRRKQCGPVAVAEIRKKCNEIGNRSEASGLSGYLPRETNESHSICAGVAQSIWSPATERMGVIHPRHKQDYFLAHSTQAGSGAHTTSYPTATGGLFPRQ
jgi:hypothetical protein